MTAARRICDDRQHARFAIPEIDHPASLWARCVVCLWNGTIVQTRRVHKEAVDVVIVEPDFLDHWKTLRLVRATADPTAPQLILRLWAHCQNRKTARLSGVDDDALAAICRWNKPPAELKAALIDCGFIRIEGEILIVHDWDDTNRMLVSAWENGRKHKSKKTNRRDTHRLSTGNRSDTGRLSDRQPVPLSHLSIDKERKDESAERRKPKTIDEVVDYAAKHGISDPDARAFYHSMEAGGWTRAGKALKSWQAHLISYREHGYLASQKQVSRNSSQPRLPAKSPRDERLERERLEAQRKYDETRQDRDHH